VKRLGIVPLLIAGLALTGCSGDEEPGVQVAQVRRAPVQEIVEAPATVTARATAALRSPAAGTVAKLYVHDGEKVSEGQLIAKIGSPEARARLKQARGAERAASRAAPPISVPGGGSPLRLASVDLGPIDRQVSAEFDRARAAAKKIEDAGTRKALLTAIDRAERQHRAQRRTLTKITKQLTRSVDQALSRVSGQLSAGLDGLSGSMKALQAASKAQAKAAVTTAEATVRGLTIKAPFDGVVTLGGASGGGSPGLGGLLSQLPAGVAGQAPAAGAEVPAAGQGGAATTGTIATGVPVSAGDTIATVTDVSRLGLSADVDETDVLQVGKGVPAEAELDAVTGARYTARVTAVGVTPKQGSTGGVSYAVRLSLGKGTYDDGTRAPVPKPGMSAVVRLTVRDSPDAVAVPSSAIDTSGRDSIVWVVQGTGDEGVAARRVVKLGAQGDAEVEVLSGVGVGDRVVVKGADTVRQGQRIP
jgi:multidrug efflux pump subunit AcrA (membrane-fusion protein)